MTNIGNSIPEQWSNPPLKAVYINCSLNPDAKDSHTQRLIERSAGIMTTEGVQVTIIHALEHQIPFGMATDMTQHGAARDDWPAIQAMIDDADILVLGTPIWLGVKSSVATLVVERMYAGSSETNERGQYRYYGKTAGCVVTGNEDGVKACARDVLYAMAHIGYTIPPQPDCGWIGEIGPGPSYGDTTDNGQPVGYDSEFTNKNTTIMTWNLIHLAHMLRTNDGIPAHGNTANTWQDATNATQQPVSPPL